MSWKGTQAISNGMLIGGELAPAASGNSFRVINPATGESVGEAALGSAEDADRAITEAHLAFTSWAQTPPAKRAETLRRAGDLVISRQDTIARLITLESGKPLRASLREVAAGAKFVYWFAEEARRSYGEWIPDPLPDRRLLTIRQPVGVAAIITPWNFPAYMVARMTSAALAAGCTVVIKPARQTSLTGLALACAFKDAGVPAGVLNMVTGDSHTIGQAFLEDQRVRKIAFAGSTEVGKLLMRGAANHIKRISLELGGNAPFIIMSDAALDKAIAGVLATKFENAGQMCIAPNRIYVHASLLEAFLQRLTLQVTRLKVGPGLDLETQIGPLINERALEKVDSHVRDALHHGARLLTGGHRLTEGACAKGTFYAPTVLADVTTNMRITHEETFGPVAPVLAFDAEDDVIERANNTPYGLAAYLYTRDVSTAVRVAERLEFGMVGVNDTRIAAVEAPFGGMKLSGIGREGGREGLAAFLETKQIALGL
ncbi:MAG: NAD-dependent succinate-semialdehyde dehydrogenase [Halobacteriota archaeon]